MRLVKANKLGPSPCLYLFSINSYGKNVFWPDDVTMCHNNVRFLSITFDRKEIETWGRCQTVCLDETHRQICNMTYLGHFRDLT